MYMGRQRLVPWLKDAMHLAELQVVLFWVCLDTQAGEIKATSWEEKPGMILSGTLYLVFDDYSLLGTRFLMILIV